MYGNKVINSSNDFMYSQIMSHETIVVLMKKNILDFKSSSDSYRRVRGAAFDSRLWLHRAKTEKD